jgi:uncharacterized membrane protein
MLTSRSTVILINVLVMLLFAAVYYAVGLKKNFNLPAFQDKDTPDYFFALYFSTITHSTAGFGDCYPTSGKARMLVMTHLLLAMVMNVYLLT